MTRRPARAVHHWLTQHSRALSHVLDTEAGLTAILLGPATAPPSRADATDTVSPFLALSPADRMALRNHPDVRKASRALAAVHRSVHRRTRAFSCLLLASVRELAVDLVHVLALDLDLVRTHTRACAFDIDQYVLEVARLSEALDRDFELALDDSLLLAQDLTRDLVYTFDMGCDLVHAPEVEQHMIQTTCLTLIEIRAAELRRAIGQALKQPTPTLEEPALRALLDNFTTADLTTADLTGIDLSGVRWSEHTTRWPPDIDSNDLKSRSRETHPGSGTWIVRSGTATIHDLAL